MKTIDDYDNPWKTILENYFEEFMAFFFPDAHRDIDWSQAYQSLDKELQQIARDAELGKRYADKLMQVWRRTGEMQLVLIHVEVQGNYDVDFDKRMYVYNYRIFDRYEQPVVSLAILGDDNPGWRPNAYYHELWGCRTGITFPIIKLTDYNQRWDELEANDNVFAIAVMAHLQTRATRNNLETRLQWKLRLVRELYQRGYQRQIIINLFHFIDWLLWLPKELDEQFEIQLNKYEAPMGTPYISQLERRAIKRGIEQGQILHTRDALITILEARFGELPTELHEQINTLTAFPILQSLLKSAATSESLEAFRIALRATLSSNDH